MKKKYVGIELEVVDIFLNDVLTTSGPLDDPWDDDVFDDYDD